jgi:hypothetical protein
MLPAKNKCHEEEAEGLGLETTNPLEIHTTIGETR